MPYSKSLYRILEIYIPISTVILWSPIPAILYRAFALNPTVTFYEIHWCLAGLISGVLSSFYVTAIKKNTQQYTIGDLRGGIFIMLLSYILMSLFLRAAPGGSAAAEVPFYVEEADNFLFLRPFMPSVNSVLIALVSFYIWFSVIFLKKTFATLELFLSFTVDYRGEQLQHQMREFAPEMIWTEQELKNLMRNYGMQFIPPSLILSAPSISQNNPPMLTALVFIIFSAGFLLLGFLGLQRRELLCASEGVSLGLRDKVLPIPVMALGIGIAALLALAGSSDNSFLPPEIVFAFIAWIVRLLSSLFIPLEPPDFDFMRRGGGGFSQDDMVPMLEEGYTEAWGGWIYARYILIGLLALLFLLFMIQPFIRNKGFSLRPSLILSALILWAVNLKKDILSFFSAFREKGKSVRLPDREKLEKITSELLAGNVKRKDVKRSVNLFARLVLWGIESINVPWKPSFAPGEYSLLLAEAVSARPVPAASGPGSSPALEPGLVPAAAGEICEGIIRSAVLFEKALYSTQPLSRAEEREYQSLVEKITAS